LDTVAQYDRPSDMVNTDQYTDWTSETETELDLDSLILQARPSIVLVKLCGISSGSDLILYMPPRLAT